jgi:hypothetical protein
MKNRKLLIALLGVFVWVSPAWAEDKPAEKPAAEKPAEGAKPADAAKPGEQPSAEDVLNQLLKKRAENPLIEPAVPPSKPVTPTRTGIAPSIKPTAPGAPGSQLRREGQFIVTRRGRLLRAAATPGTPAAPNTPTPWVFVFEADSKGLSDPPMYVMPCQMLEDMEAIAEQHGDALVFVLSGQVFVYRGANYLLPTLMKLAPQKNNLQP